MKVLVCGGAGYIGSNMTAKLAAEGHELAFWGNKPVLSPVISRATRCIICLHSGTLRKTDMISLAGS